MYKSITGRVILMDIITGKILYRTNAICNGIAEFMAGKAKDDTLYTISHIHGQWGTTLNFAEGGGPYFTPNETDDIASLTTPTISTVVEPILRKFTTTAPDQNLFTNNVLTVEAFLTQQDGDIYVGAGLVCSHNNILLAHVSFPGILKIATHDILVSWDITYENS